jgi:hypothetical protein
LPDRSTISVVSQIEDQTINEGEPFIPIPLDNLAGQRPGEIFKKF